LPYFIGTRQTSSQYENTIKPSINRAENQFNTPNSACWFGTPVQEWPPQALQQPSSSFMTVRHSQHCFDISRIMPDASWVIYPQKAEKVMVLAAPLVYRTNQGLAAHWPQAVNAVSPEPGSVSKPG
jgi:hypothetical protein